MAAPGPRPGTPVRDKREGEDMAAVQRIALSTRYPVDPKQASEPVVRPVYPLVFRRDEQRPSRCAAVWQVMAEYNDW